MSKNHNHNHLHEELELQGGQEKSNRIWIGDVTDELAQSFSERVLEINREDPSRPIVLYINSDGGSVYALNTMLSIMDSVQNSFVTVALGRAMSAGADLLAHGDLRFVSEHSRVMIHQSSGGAGGHVEDVKSGIEELIAINSLSMAVLAKDMGKTPSELEAFFKLKGRDIYLSPSEAVKMGLADHIGIPSVRELPLTQMKYEIAIEQPQKQGTDRRNGKGKKPPKAQKTPKARKVHKKA